MSMKGFVQWVAALAVIFLVSIAIFSMQKPVPPSVSPTPVVSLSPGSTPSPIFLSGDDLKSFKSYDEVSAFLSSSSSSNGGYPGYAIAEAMPLAAAPTSKSADSSSGAGAADYSTTNVQVQGVDEADTFKTDGRYIYTVTNGQIALLDAFPAENLKVLSVLNKSSYSGLFVNGNTLVAFGEGRFDWEPIIKPMQDQYSKTEPVGVQGKVAAGAMPSRMIAPDYYPYYGGSSLLEIYDISDRASPKLLKKIDSKGNYVTARMIGDKVYVIYSDYASFGVPRPLYAIDGQVREFPASDITYIDYPFESYQFTTVLGLDLSDLEKAESRKVVLMGGAQTVYVSKDNAYLSYTRYNTYFPVWKAYENVLTPFPYDVQVKLDAVEDTDASSWRKDNLKVQVVQGYLAELDEKDSAELYGEIYKEEQALRDAQDTPTERTVIHKFSLGDAIAYLGKGDVPGHVLNQFALDEFESNLRVATTVGEVFRGGISPRCMPGSKCIAQATPEPAKNNVYVLDSTLQTIGRLEDLAPGEKIYSARFMGKKAYLVTFKKVDPLFVIGLENPQSPTLLGKLKIPGYSDYLHPYDENLLIGLGKDAVPAEEGDFAWYQGVKLSMFDVSDVANPKEVASYSIGDRGTDSYALNDHKAFLFSRERNLLVIPVTLAKIDPAKYPQGVNPQSYGDYVFQGAYVFSTADCAPQVAAQCSFQLKGTVSHAKPEDLAKSGEYYYGGGTDVERSAYLDDVLYTVSQRYVKANALSDLSQRGEVALPYPVRDYPYYDDVITVR